MSRDFTPLERFVSNKQSGYDLWLDNYRLVNMETGEETPVFTEEEQSVRLRYRNLAVAMSDAFLKLYNALPEAVREEKIQLLEDMQIKLQGAFLKGKEAFNKCELPETMKDWFVGKLDPGFYYSETNDQLYLDWCLDYLKN